MFFGMGYLFFGATAEDAYIVARYANNFIAGKGLVYNEGEWINALTSPMHFFIITGLRYMAADPISLYGVLMLGLVPIVLIAVGITLYGRSTSLWLYLSLALLSPFVVMWSVGGLETPLLLVLITIITALFLRREESPKDRDDIWIVLLSGLAVLTRYDSVVFLLPLIIWILWQKRGSRAIWIAGALSAFMVLGWLGFTAFYFGDLFPTSFYTKSPLSQNKEVLWRGALYLVSFLLLSLIFLLPLFRRLPTSGTVPRPANTGRWRMVGFGLMLFGIYAVLAGNKHMMYSYRLYVPFLPAAVLLLLKQDAFRMTAIGVMQKIILLFVIAYQITLAYVIVEYSSNVNITILFKRQTPFNEIFEFSTHGAKHINSALNLFHQGAQDTKQHWAFTHPGSQDVPRMYNVPGGMLPFAYPELHAYEPLGSYRHHCNYDLTETAHYVYLIYYAVQQRDVPDIVFGARRGDWQLISSYLLELTGIADDFSLRLEIYYQEKPGPNRLPPRIDQPCLHH